MLQVFKSDAFVLLGYEGIPLQLQILISLEALDKTKKTIYDNDNR